jgi:Flp pilus assembly protein TadB
MAEEECPYCGELIDAEATFCKHCGNDAETGWNPDSDYESVELPEEDDPERPARAAARDGQASLRNLLGPALVVSSWFTFVVVASSHYHPPGWVLVPAIYLAAAIFIVSRLSMRRDRRARRPARR